MTHATRIGFLLIASIDAVAGLRAQTPVNTSRATFCAAWLVEHLDREPEAARSAYAAAAASDPTRECRALALAFRVEIDRVLGADDDAERGMAELRAMFPTTRPQPSAALDLPREELRAALAIPVSDASHDAAVARARESFAELLAVRRMNQTSLRFVEFNARGRLDDERSAARDPRRLPEPVRRSEQPEADQPTTPAASARASLGSRPLGAVGAWRERALQLLCDERVDAAERLRARILGPGEVPAASLTELRARAGLSAGERAALEMLAARLEDWRRDGREAAVTRALAALPYGARAN